MSPVTPQVPGELAEDLAGREKNGSTKFEIFFELKAIPLSRVTASINKSIPIYYDYPTSERPCGNSAYVKITGKPYLLVG
jgi:hypothetical protein